MDIIGASHPFFRSAIRRKVIVATCLVWTLVEWIYGDPFWGIVSSGIFVLATHDLLWAYNKNHGVQTSLENKVLPENPAVPDARDLDAKS